MLKTSGFHWTRSLFVRLILSFVLIIAIFLAAEICSYKMYMDSIQKETNRNANERLDNLVIKSSQYFDYVHEKMVEASVSSVFTPVSNGEFIDNYDEKLISDMLVSYMHNFKYVNNIILINKKSPFVVTPEGTFIRDNFFNQMYFNSSYSEDFWIEETTKKFTYQYYPAALFKKRNYPGQTSQAYLLPVVIKRFGNSNYILIALIDVNGLTESIESKFFENLFIYNDNHTLLFPLKKELDEVNLPIQSPEDFQQVNNNLVFYRQNQNLSYYKIISNTQITDGLKTTKLMFLLVILFSLGVSLLISVYLAKKNNSPVKQILDSMQKSELTSFADNTMDLKLIRDNMQKVISLNYGYIHDIHRKDAALKHLSYLAKVKNINIGLNEFLDGVILPKKFIMINFKVHYRELFFTSISENKNKGSFFINELLQIYLDEFFTNVITFLGECDEIICIAEISENDRDFMEVLINILEKLKPESEYVYFTVAVSNLCDSISEVDKIYNRIVEIVRYRKLFEGNQILTENDILTKNEILSFDSDQVEWFANCLCSKNSSECISNMKSILEYNVKKDVSEYYIKLLSIEFVNCCIKVLIKEYLEVPPCFQMAHVFNNLERCATLKEFEDVLQDLLLSVICYMEEHRKESDYIIDFTKQYVEQNYKNDISVELIADKLNITKNYLSAYFKKKSGVNLSEYINNTRIKISMELLKNPAVKIQDVGVSVGIPNVNTFIRLFRKYTGKSPGEYRKSQI